MKDKLEQFAEEHKWEFDEYEAPAHAWQRIQNNMPKPAPKPFPAWPVMAASILLIAGSFVWFFRHSEKIAAPTPVVVTGAPAATPDIAEAETYYKGMINDQRKQIQQYCGKYPDLCHDLEQEMKTLDEYYSLLKTEYSATGNKDVIKQSMIENLQAQAELAASQLKIVEQINKDNKHNLG